MDCPFIFATMPCLPAAAATEPSWWGAVLFYACWFGFVGGVLYLHWREISRPRHLDEPTRREAVRLPEGL